MNDLAPKNLSPQCSLCHQEYDLYYHIPRVVPKCGHTFCEKCIVLRLSVKSNRRVYICNQCGAQVVVRKNVGEDVPKNIVMIDMIKNIKKYAINDRQDDKKISSSENCLEHSKIKELVCETCNYKKICSHCALFGQHKNHIFCKEVPATKINFTQLKQSFKIVSESVQNFLMPNGQHNIKKNMLSQITEGLKKQITASFKQFYDIIEKKQFQLLKQCDNIIIANEGGIDKTIDDLIRQYDRLRNKYDSQFKVYTELGLSSQKGGIGLDSIDQFLAKCEQLHKNLEAIQKQAKDHSSKTMKQIGSHISQAGFFKIQQIPFSLVRIIQYLNNFSSNEVTSPTKQRTRLKSTNSEIKPKNVLTNSEIQHNNFVNFDKTQKGSKTVTYYIDKKDRDSFSQIQKRDLQRDDFSMIQPQCSELGYYKQQIHKQPINKGPHEKNIERGSLPPKAAKVKILGNFDSKTTNTKSIAKQQVNKYGQKVPRSPARAVNSVQKSSKSILNREDSSLTEELKFVCPSKSISAQLMSKLQQLISEVDRQFQIDSSTLQLNSLDLTDTLLLYLIDYIRTKKYTFQVVKIVKNLLSDQGLKILLSYLVTDNCTQVLNLTSNHLTVRSLQLILLFASKNYILRTIYLSNNKISSLQAKSRREQLNKYQLQIIV